MSRRYMMSVEISGFDVKRKDAIIEAAQTEWTFPGWDELAEPPLLWSKGEYNLYGGESEDEFANRLAAAIWVANRGPCEVEIVATYMEELPHETYKFDEDDPPKPIEGEPKEESA